MTLDPHDTMLGDERIARQLYGEDVTIRYEERGGIPLAVLILVGLVVVMILGLGLCGDALFDDEDETDDLGQTELIVSRDRGDDSSDGSGECSDSRGQCSDDDLSPRFDDSPVWVCLPGSTCHGPA